ncbi:MAG: hypothetical protein M1826_006718 [Phylliscum demangeonii]|nr:MAG: hypothetical protein M1826_006718 [Phylliscum demangeonii]
MTEPEDLEEDIFADLPIMILVLEDLDHRQPLNLPHQFQSRPRRPLVNPRQLIRKSTNPTFKKMSMTMGLLKLPIIAQMDKSQQSKRALRIVAQGGLPVIIMHERAIGRHKSYR